MAKSAFSYKRNRPLLIEVSVKGSVTAFVTIAPTPRSTSSGKASEQTPFSRQIGAAVPHRVRVLYQIRGDSNQRFVVNTRLTQGGRCVVLSRAGNTGAGKVPHWSVTLTAARWKQKTRPDISRRWGQIRFRHDSDRSKAKSVDIQQYVGAGNVIVGVLASLLSAELPKVDFYDVWFGTNRTPITEGRLLKGFSADRDAVPHYGKCNIAIPESHKIGSLGSSWFERTRRGTDDRLRRRSLAEWDETKYWDDVASALQLCVDDDRNAVMFLHGYNVSFDGAALRAAQLGYDLGINGIMAFYSWPSQGSLDGYLADEASLEASEGFITDYLTALVTRSGASKVHIIAHSMGNRALLRVMDRIATTAAERTQKPFNQIIVAAADVDQDTFRRLSVAYQQVAERTTMYVCSKDRAVEASHWLHEYPRAGLTPPVLVVPGIDTISVSNLDLTGLAHGYVAEARDVLQDMYHLLREGAPPEKRFGLQQEVTTRGETYWEVGR